MDRSKTAHGLEGDFLAVRHPDNHKSAGEEADSRHGWDWMGLSEGNSNARVPSKRRTCHLPACMNRLWMSKNKTERHMKREVPSISPGVPLHMPGFSAALRDKGMTRPKAMRNERVNGYERRKSE